MDCPKTYFANEEQALFYIKKLKATSKRIKVPVRAYLCNKCFNWHLTSQTEHQVSVLEERNKEVRIKNKRIGDLEIENKRLKKEVKSLNSDLTEVRKQRDDYLRQIITEMNR